MLAYRQQIEMTNTNTIITPPPTTTKHHHHNDNDDDAIARALQNVEFEIAQQEHDELVIDDDFNAKEYQASR